MTNLIDTTEMYLRTILDLEEEGITPLRARISERLGHSGPTVSQTIARMERDGLVEVAPDRTLVLTTAGRETAVRVLRKHRIAESLLAKIIGLDLSLVHDEACRWEHVMSDEVEARIFTMLGEPAESPYGTPIPTLDDGYRKASSIFHAGVSSVTEVLREIAGGEEAQLVLRRLGEPVQSDDDLLRKLHECDLMPEAPIVASLQGEFVRMSAVGNTATLEVPCELAAHIYVVHPTL